MLKAIVNCQKLKKGFLHLLWMNSALLRLNHISN